MCISRTKAAMMGPLVSANFLPVLSGSSCDASIRFTVLPLLQRPALCTDTSAHHGAEVTGDCGLNQGDFKGSEMH